MSALLLACQKAMQTLTTQYGKNATEHGPLVIFKTILEDMRALEK